MIAPLIESSLATSKTLALSDATGRARTRLANIWLVLLKAHDAHRRRLQTTDCNKQRAMIKSAKFSS